MSQLVHEREPDFTATAVHAERAITETLTGNADNAAIAALDRALTAVHAAATELAIGEAVVDLRRLEFMNSSCFKSFVTWISDVQELATPRQYKLRFLSDPRMHWQKRSLHALRCFAVELIAVETPEA